MGILMHQHLKRIVSLFDSNGYTRRQAFGKPSLKKWIGRWHDYVGTIRFQTQSGNPFIVGKKAHQSCKMAKRYEIF